MEDLTYTTITQLTSYNKQLEEENKNLKAQITKLQEDNEKLSNNVQKVNQFKNDVIIGLEELQEIEREYL